MGEILTRRKEKEDNIIKHKNIFQIPNAKNTGLRLMIFGHLYTLGQMLHIHVIFHDH
jgi:hypothetical protein